MTTEPKKKPPLTPALALSMMALAIAVVALMSSNSPNNNDISEIKQDLNQLQTNMTQFSNFTKNQGTFNIKVINWATQTEQKINFLVNQTSELEK